MRLTFFILILAVMVASCKKDKYTTEPQLSFKKFRPNQGNNLMNISEAPYAVFEITDAEGDIGLTADDTSQIFVKNLLTNKVDSQLLPNLQTVAGKDFKAEIEVSLFGSMSGRPTSTPGLTRPYVDTLSFEVYVVDFAGHKSNVVHTTEPFYYTTF